MIKNPQKYLIILFLVSILLFLLDEVRVFGSIFEFFQHSIVQPIIRAGDGVFDGSVSIFESLFLVQSFLEENDNLKSSRDFYRGEYLRLRAIEEENNFLRKNLGFEKRGGNQLILSKIISFDPLQPNQFLTVDKGKNDGVEEGQAVILAGQILIGKVKKVNDTTSRIVLITSEASRITSILEHSNTNGIIVGSASSALILDLVLKDVELQLGEIVMTSGLGGGIPKNLLIGEITKIIDDETSPFNKAVVSPFFNFNNLDQLFILIK